MKLQLAAKGSYHVLSVDGIVDKHQFDILRAGITKLFTSGKNRIVLHFTQAKDIPIEILERLAEINLVAKELAGEIVLSGISPQVHQRVRNFASSSAIYAFNSEEEAAKHLNRPGAAAAGKPTASAGPPMPPIEGLDKAIEEIQRLREQIKQKETGGELAKLKQENSELKAKTATLEKSLIALFIERKAPPDEAAYKSKISQLEGSLLQLTQSVEEDNKKKK